MSVEHSKRSVVIVGAGPAGAALSLFLSKFKIYHHVVDMDTFPRDKTCGDGLTSEVLRVVKIINEDFYKELIGADWLYPSYGGYFETNGGPKFNLDSSGLGSEIAPFYVAKREVFDTWLVEKFDTEYCNFVQGCKIEDVQRKEDGVLVKGQKEGTEHTFFGDMVVGADGERSIVRKLFHKKGIKKDRKHHIAALRQYYKGITKEFENDPLECYQISKKYRGYFWIFPLPNGEFNVGIGGVSEDISEGKIKLREELVSFVENHPKLKERFANANPLESPKGWGIPMNSDAYEFAGERFILLGDSAKFGEPLTGKGIGVAMHCAMHAVPTIKEAVAKNDFSESMMNRFEEKIQKKFRVEWDKLIFAQNNWKRTWMQLLIYIMSIGWVNRKINKRFTKKLNRFVFREPPADLGL